MIEIRTKCAFLHQYTAKTSSLFMVSVEIQGLQSGLSGFS